MPSTITDFNTQIQKLSPNVQVGTDTVIASTAFNVSGGNIFRREITINNTVSPANVARANYLISFIINHQSWNTGDNPKTGFLLNSLRIYDTDGVTRLNHWVEGDMTTTCMIFALVPSITANSTKIIYIEYGNNALADLRGFAATCGAVFSKLAPYGSLRRSLVANFMANDAARFHEGQFRDGFRPPMWMNRATNNQLEHVMKRNADVSANMNNLPVLNYNRQNTLPAMNFDGVDDSLQGWFRSVWLLNDQEFTMFEVLRPNTIASCQSAVRLQSNSPYIHNQFNAANPAVTDTYMISHFGSSALFILSFDGGTTGLSNGIIANTWQLSCQTWKRNTTNGMQTYRNGALVAQRNSSTNPIPSFAIGSESNVFTPTLNIGSLNGAAEFFAGDIGQIMIFSEQLSTAERQQVETYLNTKWRLYNTNTFPTVTVGNETAITNAFTFTSHAPFASYNYSTKLSDNIATGEGSVDIMRILYTPFAPVITAQNWTGAGSNTTTSENLSTPYTRKITATTSAQQTTVTFSRIQAGFNHARLDAFILDNIVTGSKTYPSTDDDFIQFELYVSNTNLNLINSWIQFENAAGTATRRAALSTSLNGAIEAGRNVIRIRKSSFAPVSGTLPWSDAVFMRIQVQTSSSTCDVEVTQFKLECDYERITATQIGSIMNLATSVSSDNDATYYTNNQLLARVRNRAVDEEAISIDVEDVLSRLDSIKFYELPSMPAVSIVYSSFNYSGVKNWQRQFYTYFVTRILLLLFPISLLDIDLDLPASEFASGSSTKMEFDGFNAWDSVGEVLRRFLAPIGGVLAYNPLTNKITARNAYKTITNITNELPTPFKPVIFEYKSKKGESDNAYNALEPVRNYWKYWNGTNFPISWGAGFGFGDGQQFIRVTAASGVRSETFHNVEEMSNVGIDYDDKKNVIQSELWHFNGWNATVSTNDSTVSTSNCAPIAATLTQTGTVIISWRNTGNLRYFRAAGFGFNCVYCTEFASSATGKVATLENANNIRIQGRKEKGVNPNHALIILDGSNNPVFTPIASVLMNASQTQEQYVVDCQLTPNLRVGGVVSIENKEGKRIMGYVEELTEYSAPDEYTQTITVKPIV